MVQRQQADGILLLPDNLSNSIRHGEVGGVGLYLSAANSLKTKQIGLGLATSIENALAEQAEKFSNISHFSRTVHSSNTAIQYLIWLQKSYIFPAVAPLIIHQTIVLGLCMLLASYREQYQWKLLQLNFG